MPPSFIPPPFPPDPSDPSGPASTRGKGRISSSSEQAIPTARGMTVVSAKTEEKRIESGPFLKLLGFAGSYQKD
jgi:hypothetical protein